MVTQTTGATRIGWVLRDMMQSTGVWTFDRTSIAELAQLAAKAGFSHLEIGGGQSFQIALQNQANPYRLLSEVKTHLDNSGQAMPLQLLLRGANQFGFRHYSSTVQQKNLDLLVEAAGDPLKSRALVVRIFDALNDVENLRFSIEHLARQNVRAASEGGKQVNIQPALSYVKPSGGDIAQLYSIEYYAAYASKLVDLARETGGQIDSLCIKDMSSQLDAATARVLVQRLKSLGVPVFLHCHSTDEASSLAALLSAAQVGIDGVEVALSPLAGGASHQDVRSLAGFPFFPELDPHTLDQLETRCDKLFASRVAQRKDFRLPLGSLKELAAVGIPGGAIPFIVNDLQEQVCGTFQISLDQAILEFTEELEQLQLALGQLPLVTPTADIIAKQVIKNLGNRARAEKYKLMDPRFCALVLGHYGEVINHASAEKVAVSPALVDEVMAYCSAIEPDESGRRIKSGKAYPDPVILYRHPSLEVDDSELQRCTDYVTELHERYPESMARFGSRDECVMMQIMRPAGNAERLLARNILGPTEERLRLLLKKTLAMLPGMRVPESREPRDNEETDFLLLDTLGDYEGIVTSIRDLVMGAGPADLEYRVRNMKDEIVGKICRKNSAANTNRLYIENRFVSLFAAAVFWDLQRVCRRTGADSRADMDEPTASSLGRIISTTLRKRKEAGVGQASRYLV